MEKLLEWGDELLARGSVIDLNKITKNAGGDYDHIVQFAFERNFFIKKGAATALSLSATSMMDNDDASHEDLISELGWHQYQLDK